MIRTVGLSGRLFFGLLLVGCQGGAAAGMEPDTGSEGSGGSGGDEVSDSSGDDGTGDDPDTGVACEVPSVGLTPLRRLTSQQYANAVRDVLAVPVDRGALPADEKAGAFDSNFSAAVSTTTVEQYRIAAEDLAASATADLETLSPCAPGDGDSCTTAFIEDAGRRLFRRDLTATEVGAYQGLADRGSDRADGLRLVVSAMLQSVNFLYHVEFGLPAGDAEVVELADYELASRLAFFIWDSVPDTELLDAANAGDLRTPDGLRASAERLLDDPRAREAVGNFHIQWLGLDELVDEYKDPAVYPGYSREVAEAMVAETHRFGSHVVLQGDGKLETLMTASYSYLDDELFEIYGVEKPSGHNAGVPVDLDPAERAGLLTQPAFLTAHALPNASGPIQRGVELRTNVLCAPPPPAPDDADVSPPTIDPNATTREAFEQHVADPSCAGCHQFIDGIGLGFEAYDGIGAFRTTENGLPVDATGAIFGTDVDGEFDGAVELAHRLADSQQVRECVSRQWFRFAFGRLEQVEDQCSVQSLNEAFAESNYDVRALLLQIVQTDAFRLKAVD